MARQPGGLSELDEAGVKAWDQTLSTVVDNTTIPKQVQAVADAKTPEVTGPDWPAYPARVE